AFAIGRVEEVLYWLKRLEDEKRIPVLPVYVDSPMAVAALQFYAGRLNELDADLTTTPSRSGGDQAAIRSAAGRDQVAARPGSGSNRMRDGLRRGAALPPPPQTGVSPR